MAPRRSYPKTTRPMDEWLDSQGYYRKHTARDGSSLFRAVSEQVYKTQSFHEDVRRECVEFVKRNKDQFEKFLEESIEEYSTRMMSSKGWGGALEIRAMALLYKRDVHIFEEVGKLPNVVTDYGFTKTILLCWSSDNFYDSVYTKSFIVAAGFCQSIAYEVLYKNVFKLSDVNYAVNKMLHDKPNRLQKDRLTNEDVIAFGFSMEFSLELNKEYRDDEDMNVKELIAQGYHPFPYKVAKALDPNIYRNIEFDVWNNYIKDLRFGWYRSNGELQVGVKCLVKLDPDRNFHAHIQEMSPDKGPAIVYVEELGGKFAHEQMGNQQIQVPFPNFSQQSFQNLQNFNNVGMDVPMSGCTSTNSPPRSQGLVSLSCSTTTTNIHTTKPQCTEMTSDRCLSPVQQPDSTTDIPSSQQPALESQTSYVPPQPMCFSSPPPVIPQTGADNSSVLPQHMYNTGASASTTAGHEQQQPRDVMFQPVNFMAQKSLQLNGSDLPLSDLPTLRFYYNLGQETTPNFVQLPNAASYNETVGYTTSVPPFNNVLINENRATESVALPTDVYQEVPRGYLLSNEQNVHLATEENKTERKCQQSAGRCNEQYDVQTTLQPTQETENAYGHVVNEVQAQTSNVINNGYNIISSTVPYTFYNHTVVPFYLPVHSDQNIVPVQYYQQCATVQEAAEPADTQSRVCQVQPSENNCFPSCGVPLMFQPPTPGYTGMSVPQWVQPFQPS
ncbi:hypothetical protein L9F63_026645, partial [Diploptera punctata]